MELKKINIKDYGELLYRMDVESFIRPFDYPSPSVAMTLSYLSGCQVYLAIVGNTPAGVLAYEKKNGKIEVKQILVLPRFQGKGYGRMIVEYLKKVTMGERVWLVTHPKNIPAIILYLKNGFRITGWNDDYYGDGQPRLILRLTEEE